MSNTRDRLVLVALLLLLGYFIWHCFQTPSGVETLRPIAAQPAGFYQPTDSLNQKQTGYYARTRTMPSYFLASLLLYRTNPTAYREQNRTANNSGSRTYRGYGSGGFSGGGSSGYSRGGGGGSSGGGGK